MNKFYNIEIEDDNFINISNPNSKTLCYRMNYTDLKSDKYDKKINNPFIVYILQKKNNNDKDTLYIGKSKNCISYRPKSHNNIDWDMCYVLTQVNDRTILNDGTIQYLEDQLTDIAKKTNCYNIETRQTTKDTANDKDKYHCNEFLKEALEMLYILGLDLKTTKSIIQDQQIVGTQELLVNQLFSGDYLTMGDNVGHEITNIIRDDNGIFNLYIAPGGNNISDKHDISTILFVKNDFRPNVVEVIAIATDLKPYNNEDFIYNGNTYKEIYTGNQFNGKIESNIDVLIVYRTANIQMPVKPLYIGVKDLVNDPDVELIDNNGTRLTNTSMRSYHKQFKAIIDKTSWKPLDTDEIYQRFSKHKGFKIQYERFINKIGLAVSKNNKSDNNDTYMIAYDTDLYTFKDCDIPIGSELTFRKKHKNIKVTTVDEINQVNYNGTIMNISKAAWYCFNQYDGWQYNGFKDFCYNGRRLYDIYYDKHFTTYMLKCKICGKYLNKKAFSLHLYNVHKLTKEEYIKKYADQKIDQIKDSTV